MYMYIKYLYMYEAYTKYITGQHKSFPLQQFYHCNNRESLYRKLILRSMLGILNKGLEIQNNGFFVPSVE